MAVLSLPVTPVYGADLGSPPDAGLSAPPDTGLSAPPDAGQAPLADPGADLESVDISGLQQLLDEVNRQLGGDVPPLRFQDFIGFMQTRGAGYSFTRLGQGILDYLFHEVLANSRLLGRLVVLAVLAALLQNLQSAFERESVGRLAYFVVYLVLVVLALGGFGVVVTAASDAIKDLTTFMWALLPVLIALLAGTGSVTLAGLFHPTMIATINVVSLAAREIVFPLIFFSAVIEIVGSLSDSFKISNLSGFLRQVSLTILGGMFSLFLGVTVIQGAAGSVADGFTLRTAKFMAASFVPVIGKMFGDAAELVIGSSLALKSAVGLLGSTAILVIAVFPLAKVVAVIIAYRLAAVIVQPVGAGRVVDCLNGIASALNLVFLAVATVALMFFVGTTMIILAGNAAVMMR
ncbi:MAG: stage III sporulation protein AE [Bacillota bacterium]